MTGVQEQPARPPAALISLGCGWPKQCRDVEPTDARPLHLNEATPDAVVERALDVTGHDC
jgi:hypothetical protein